MARVFEPDHAGINQIARSPEMRAALAAVGAEMMSKAVAMAEDFRSDKDHPHYADSFNMGPTTVDWKGLYPGMRGCVIVRNTSDHALEVEFGHEIPAKQGGGSVPGHHIFGRILGAMGSG